MRLLYVTDDVPNRDPVHGNGGSMISYGLLTQLQLDIDVHLITFAGEVAVPAEVVRRCSKVTVLPLDRSRPRPWSTFASALSPYDLESRQRLAPTIKHQVAAASTMVDVTLLHGPHLLGLASVVRGPVVVQSIDPPSDFRRMYADLATGLRRHYRALKARQTREVERSLPPEAILLTVGVEDAGRWSHVLGRPVVAIPNGVDEVHNPRVRTEKPTVCFLGSLDYAPNVESARVLVEDVAPRIWARRPDVHVVIAGRTPDQAVLGLQSPRVEVLANVPSVADVFARAGVAAFPDRRGLGVRNSVREALAAGTPVVASSIAARGQEPHPLLRTTDDLEEFATLVLEALDDEVGAPRVGPSPAIRGWPQVAADYVVQLEQACRTTAG